MKRSFYLIFSALAVFAMFMAVARTPKAVAQDAIDCGTEPITLRGYFETGFDLPFRLAEEFTKQYPNVTWDISQDQFANLINATPRLLSGDNPPDLIRLPTMVSFANQGLLKNLDEYAEAFGWNDWPVPQLNQNRVAEDGTRGSGSLYAMGLNYSLTGIFYNRDQAAQIGMTEPPTTLAEFEALLAAAKEAGLLPIMQWGSAQSGMGLAFPLQALMASVGSVDPINNWIFQKPGATIDTPENLVAAQHLADWISNGYFPEDINAIEYTDANARFSEGEGVFIFNGDWQNAAYDATMSGNVGFFVMPSAEEGGSPAAMSAPLTFGIAANAVNADCAAFFFNWVGTNEVARQIGVDVGGSNPGGPSGLPMPAVAEGSITIVRSPMRRWLPARSSAKPGPRWTSSPMRPAPSSPRAGPQNCRRWSVAGRMRRVCSKPFRPNTNVSSLNSGKGRRAMPVLPDEP